MAQRKQGVDGGYDCELAPSQGKLSSIFLMEENEDERSEIKGT